MEDKYESVKIAVDSTIIDMAWNGVAEGSNGDVWNKTRWNVRLKVWDNMGYVSWIGVGACINDDIREALRER